MNKLCIGITAMLMISCNSHKPPRLKEILKTDCFWDRTGDKQVFGGLNSCYKFFPSGKCSFYYYKFYNRKRTDAVFHYDDGDVIVPEVWSVSGDTSLIIRGIQYKVLNTALDSVLLVEQSTNDSFILRKNCNTFIQR